MYRCSTLRGWKDERKWLRAAKMLNFTAQQRTRILSARSEMLEKLQRWALDLYDHVQSRAS